MLTALVQLQSATNQGHSVPWLLSTSIKRCCPTGWDLSSVNVDEDLDRWTGGQAAFKCVPYFHGNETEEWEGDSDPTETRFHLPVCAFNSKLRLHSLSDHHTVRTDPNMTCLEVDGHQIKLLTCSESVVEFIPIVYRLNKCCPLASVYSPAASACVPVEVADEGSLSNFTQSVDVSRLLSLLDQHNANDISAGVPVIVGDATPMCASDEALVTYVLAANEFTLHRNQVTVTHGRKSTFNEKHSRSRFCMDSVEAPAVEEDATNHSETSWLIRVCHRRSICERVPCIRKCCNHNERLAKDNDDTICLHHPYDLRPTFHDLGGDVHFPDPDDNQPLTVEPPGMYIDTCEGVCRVFIFDYANNKFAEEMRSAFICNKILLGIEWKNYLVWTGWRRELVIICMPISRKS